MPLLAELEELKGTLCSIYKDFAPSGAGAASWRLDLINHQSAIAN